MIRSVCEARYVLQAWERGCLIIGFMTTRKTSARETAYSEMRRRILTLELRGAQKIDEGALVEIIGVSRTPVREALHRLSAEGLVEADARGGYRVTSISLRQCRELIEAQHVLVRATTQLLIDRIDDEGLERLSDAVRAVEQAADDKDVAAVTRTNAELHILETELTRNSYLLSMAERVYTNLQRLAYLSFGGDQGGAPRLGGIEDHYSKVHDDHWEYLEALKQRDRERAEAVAVRHVKLFQTRLTRYLMEADCAGLDFSSLAADAQMG